MHADTRLFSPSPAGSRRRTDAGQTTEGGDDTGLGSVSFDGDQSDLELDLDLEPDQDHDDEFIDSGKVMSNCVGQTISFSRDVGQAFHFVSISLGVCQKYSTI